MKVCACERVSIIIVVLFSYFSLGLQGENLSTQYQPRHLLELLEVIFCQFRCVANIHKIVLQNLHRIIVSFVCLFFVALHPKSTAMVMAGRSVHLTTVFPG